MEVTHDAVERLQGIFEESWRRVRDGERPVDFSPSWFPEPCEVWTLFMNKHDVLIIDLEDLAENFGEMVNFGLAVKQSVCIHNPEDKASYLLVPPRLAEKCLVLGALA